MWIRGNGVTAGTDRLWKAELQGSVERNKMHKESARKPIRKNRKRVANIKLRLCGRLELNLLETNYAPFVFVGGVAYRL